MKDGMHEENKCLLKQMAARLPSGHRRLLGHREIVAEAEMPGIDRSKACSNQMLTRPEGLEEPCPGV